MLNRQFYSLRRDSTSTGTRETSFVDLGHEIVPGRTAYPGLPQPQLTSYLTHERSKEIYAPGYSFHIGKLCLVGSTATYIDVPFHAFPGGHDLTALDLRQVADVPATVVDTSELEIRPERFDGPELRGRAVLIRTEWSRYWGLETYSRGNHPHLSAESARLLAASGASVVGFRG